MLFILPVAASPAVACSTPAADAHTSLRELLLRLGAIIAADLDPVILPGICCDQHPCVGTTHPPCPCVRPSNLAAAVAHVQLLTGSPGGTGSWPVHGRVQPVRMAGVQQV
jgi:hypothetical protein